MASRRIILRSKGKKRSPAGEMENTGWNQNTRGRRIRTEKECRSGGWVNSILFQVKEREVLGESPLH